MDTTSAYERFLDVLSEIIYDEIIRTSTISPEISKINKPAGNIKPGENR